ncbi:YtxH domain-containing protein [Clostridioides difficile]|nr:YtxH domain-containing protein [Clostridioides difficile]EGT4001848.1 YtxH domain-containing protein [Clostridioides difficile]MBH6909659.1 YtxH domain-containing protein [Clostridioides difficile]MBH7982276.1 YtxH domain-containing protein [Clostridioides difficile]MBH8031552.1 YtxH domain-containing protein [Clostridioides difficile]
MKERIKGAFTKKKIFHFLKMALFVVVLSLILLSLLGTVAHATGLVDDTINAENLYSKYPLSNYQLDFYVDNSWSWLPWNWLDGIGKSVQYGLYCITNFVWTISLYLSNATGYVVQEAYKLDFINDMADSIGKSIQTLAGVTSNGFSSSGFYVGFLLLIILVVGLYVAYTGLIKRETSKALHAVINFVVVFILSASFIAYAPDYIKKINEFSSDISTASLDLGTKIMLPNSDSEGKDSVDLIRDSLFSIQVQQPWLLLQFGNSNAEEIGTDRVEALVSVSPEDEDGKTREEVVKTEIEDNDNNNLTIPQVVNRLGMVFFLLFFNLGITIFVFLLTGMMLFSQILFIIFAMFLPISFLLSMIPSYESMAKQAIVRVFNTIMTRAGITLIVTVAFSISSMFYNISTDYPFFMVAFLQIVCFAGIYIKLGDLMSMFSLNAGDSQSMGRRIFRRPYLFMRHRARRMERRMARAVSHGSMVGAGTGAVTGAMLSGNGSSRSNPQKDKRTFSRSNTSSSFGNRAGSAVGAVLDTKNKVKDKANAVKENIKDMPTQTAYAVYSAKEKAKSSVSDFKRGMVQEQQSRQTGRLEKQEQHRQNIADKRMELQKAQEARQAQRKADGSATTGATRPHERPATASIIPKPSAEKTQEVKRPATATTSKASEPVKTNVIKERPLSSGASDVKATQSVQPAHRQNVEKVVSQETRQNYTKDRRTKVQQTQNVQKNQQTTEKTRNLVTKKGQKKK